MNKHPTIISDLIDPPRELNSEEKSLLNVLLSRPFPGRDDLLAQVPFAKACRRCTCGCPSIDITVETGRANPARVSSGTPVEASGYDVNGDEVMVILFVEQGYISMLEIVAVGEPDVPAFPKIDTLRSVAAQ